MFIVVDIEVKPVQRSGWRTPLAFQCNAFSTVFKTGVFGRRGSEKEKGFAVFSFLGGLFLSGMLSRTSSPDRIIKAL